MIQFLVSTAGAVSASSAASSLAQRTAVDLWDWLDRINTIFGILAVAATVAAFIGVRTLVKYLARRKECFRLIEHAYGEADKEIKRCYIHTRGQKDNPANYGPDNPIDLLEHFLKIAFNPRSSEKYYMILADSGMGKTTFMVKLYKEYMCSLYRIGRKKMRLLYLGRENCLEEIKNIEEKGETILLLDALDEKQNVNSNEEAKVFLHELLKEAEPFYRVVITCRSQYFPNQKSEPDEMPFLSADIGHKMVHIHRWYLSPFSREDVRKYIRMKYSWYDRSRRKQAFQISEVIPALSARPLILSWLDDLIKIYSVRTRGVQVFHTETEIYMTIVNCWINRESNCLIKDSRGRSITDESVEEAGRRLRQFTVELAKYMFWNDIQQVRLDEVKRIAEQASVDISQFSAQGRSLLNRNADGGFKFAHKSFYDFLIAYAYAYYPEQWITDKACCFSDLTYRFIIQMALQFRVDNGSICVPLGKYPQDADGAEHTILWKLVGNQGKILYFISAKVLDIIPKELIQNIKSIRDRSEWMELFTAYLNSSEPLRYPVSGRVHLEQSFLLKAFSDKERERLIGVREKSVYVRTNRFLDIDLETPKVLLPDMVLVENLRYKENMYNPAEYTWYVANKIYGIRPSSVKESVKKALYGKRVDNVCWVLEGMDGIVTYSGGIIGLESREADYFHISEHTAKEVEKEYILSNYELGIRPVICLEYR